MEEKKKIERSPLKKQTNETELFNLTDTKFKIEIMKILKELRKAIDRNTDYCKKELETTRRSQEKLENSFEETKAN